MIHERSEAGAALCVRWSTDPPAAPDQIPVEKEYSRSWRATLHE